MIQETSKKADKAIAKRKKTALDCAKKLEAAADSLNQFIVACNECGDDSGSKQRGISDGTVMLISDLMECKSYLEAIYAK